MKNIFIFLTPVITIFFLYHSLNKPEDERKNSSLPEIQPLLQTESSKEIIQDKNDTLYQEPAVKLVQELQWHGDFFKPAMLSEEKMIEVSNILQVDSANIFPVNIQYHNLNELQIYDTFSFSIEGNDIDVYITEISEEEGLRFISGNMENEDPGFYFGLTFDASKKVIEGSFITENNITYEVHTIYGETLIIKAPERLFDSH